MPTSSVLSETTVHGVLDPITGKRRDLRLEVRADHPGGAQPVRREIDGSTWWVLPAAVDADSHMPFVPAGLRAYDLQAALHGGIHHMVVALPWQLAQAHPLPALVAELTRSALPAITPVLSVSPDAGSADFPAWLAANRSHFGDLIPAVVKLYTGDPHFQRNLDAVWSAGLKPAVFSFTDSDFDALTATAHAPLHIRHVTSRAMVDRVRSIDGTTCQTSPHMLLRLAPRRRALLAVMPTPPADADRDSLIAAIDEIDVLASDHVSPPLNSPTGPGLQTHQHFVPALLTCVQQFGLDLSSLWHRVTTAPAAVFGLEVASGSILVDPSVQPPVGLWPRQRDDRAPYLGLELNGRVMAVTRGDEMIMV